MQYRSYGQDGPEVSALGFGVMHLPTRRTRDGRGINLARSAALMRHAMVQGVNFFDVYHNGDSEVVLGRARRGWKGRPIHFQTKAAFYLDKPLAFFQEQIERALERTGAQRIDYLLFHAMLWKKFKERGKQFFKLTDWAIRRGYLRFRGFSSHDTPANIRRFIDTGEFSAMLVSYNFINPSLADTIAYAADKGMGVSLMNPVGGGTLGETTPEILRLLPGAKTSAEVALRFALSTPGVAVAMSGMSTAEQIDENVRIAGRKTYLTAGQRERLLAKVGELQRRAGRLCSTCAYCVPCPHGVNIPYNLLLLARTKLFGLSATSLKAFQGLRRSRGGDSSALACRRCGQCLSKCPNRIPIIEQLAEAARVLGT